VEELADRPAGFKPETEIGFVHLLPLSEIIAAVLQVNSPSAQKVWSVYNPLVARFGDEYTVLMDAQMDDLAKFVDPRIAEAIVRVRENNVKIVPGYDGVYGTLKIFEETVEKPKLGILKQRTMADFI